MNDRRSVEEALPGVGAVVSCVDQRERLLLRAALRHGLAYTDVAPRLSSIRYTVGDDSVLAMHAAARTTGARMVLGTGLVPGVSNVMAGAAAANVEAVNGVETALLLGVGDAYGPSALEYLLEEMTRPFLVTIDATERQVWPFTNGRVVRFPRPFGRRRAYSFPFSDQFFYPRTLRARSAIARLALDPAWLGAMVALLVRLGLPRKVQSPRVRHRIHGAIARLRRLARKRDAYALVVDVQGTLGRLRGVLAGRNQAAATAAAAAATVRALLEDEVVHPGAWLPEEVLEPDAFFSRLAAAGLTVRFEGSAGRGMPHATSATSGGGADASDAAQRREPG